MSAYKQLSEYFSEDGKKSASIIKEIGTSKYIVRFISDSGSAFSATYESEEKAEEFAEDWVQ